MNHTQTERLDLVAAARQLGPMIRDRRVESERERRLPASVLSAMHEARLFRMYVPIAYGGLETDPITSMEVVEAVAEADAAAAWNLMIGTTYGIWAAFLPEESARQIYGAPDAVVASALRASGIAHAAAGGYRVNGRPAYASGIDHCAWWNGGCIVYEDGAPRLNDTGAPHAVLVFFPATEGERLDTWDTGGLRRAASSAACDGSVVWLIVCSAGWRERETGGERFGRTLALGLRRYRRARSSGEIRAEQVRAVFRQMPIALVVNTVNAIITAAVLQQLASVALPLGWLCAVLLVTAGRCTLWLRYRSAESRVVDFTQWSWGATCGSLLAGMCWGLGGMALFPIAPVPGQIFLIFVIGGMCTGAVVMSASHLSSLLAFLLSASLPMAVLFFRQGTTTATASGAMILVFAAALSAAGLHLSRFFARTIQLRSDLEAANLRLQAEMAEREVTEAALHQAQKLEAIGRLTGGIAHDFNNLLTVVIGNLRLAVGRAGNMPSILPRLESALHAAERGATLIERLLAFARKQRLDPRSVDVNHLVIGIEDLLRRTLGNRIRIAINADADLAPARVDANQLELAILNLAINARDAMPDGGLLHIDLRNHVRDRNSPPELSLGEYVVVSISDMGTGMDEATLAHALEPFFTTKEIGSGSGLGLSMVHGFVAQSRGAMRIQSKVGEGTTVELWLPRATAPVSEAAGK